MDEEEVSITSVRLAKKRRITIKREPKDEDQHGAKSAAEEKAASQSSGGRAEAALQGEDSTCEVKPETSAAKKEETKAEAKAEVKDEVKREVKAEVKTEVK